MIVQRWRERRDSYRPAGEPFDPVRFGVEPVEEAQAWALAEGPFRRARHPGNWVYGWPIGGPSERRRLLRGFADALPYPKAAA